MHETLHYNPVYSTILCLSDTLSSDKENFSDEDPDDQLNDDMENQGEVTHHSTLRKKNRNIMFVKSVSNENFP